MNEAQRNKKESHYKETMNKILEEEMIIAEN
jgi:hypothetical protein